MRLTRLVGFLGIVLFCAGQSLFAQSKQERKEQKERVVREIVDSGRIKIDVDRAVPMAGRSVNLTSPTHWKYMVTRSCLIFLTLDVLTLLLMVVERA